MVPLPRVAPEPSFRRCRWGGTIASSCSPARDQRESGVKTFRDAGGLWRSTASRTSLRPRASPGTRGWSGASIPSAAGRRGACSRIRRTSRWRGWSARSATGCSSARKTSIRFTSAPAPGPSTTCTVSCSGPAATPAIGRRSRTNGPIWRSCRGAKQCGGRLRPHVVWFGEVPFGMDRIYQALNACDLFVTVGSSGAVYPAAGFVSHLRHNPAPAETSRAACTSGWSGRRTRTASMSAGWGRPASCCPGYSRRDCLEWCPPLTCATCSRSTRRSSARSMRGC